MTSLPVCLVFVDVLYFTFGGTGEQESQSLCWRISRVMPDDDAP